MERRPIKTRSRGWAHLLSGVMIRAGLTPNQISLLGIVFALLACLLLVYWANYSFVLLITAVCVQLRLLCNMLDGLMAVEGGRKSPMGDIFNELPDRFEDVAILIGAGYATRWPVLGWAAAVVAVLIAYVRAFTGALGQRQDFCGPMAKPQRMFVITVGCLVNAIELWMGRQDAYGLWVALVVILAGGIITIVRRTARLVRALEVK